MDMAALPVCSRLAWDYEALGREPRIINLRPCPN